MRTNPSGQRPGRRWLRRRQHELHCSTTLSARGKRQTPSPPCQPEGSVVTTHERRGRSWSQQRSPAGPGAPEGRPRGPRAPDAQHDGCDEPHVDPAARAHGWCPHPKPRYPGLTLSLLVGWALSRPTVHEERGCVGVAHVAGSGRVTDPAPGGYGEGGVGALFGGLPALCDGSVAIGALLCSSHTATWDKQAATGAAPLERTSVAAGERTTTSLGWLRATCRRVRMGAPTRGELS